MIFRVGAHFSLSAEVHTLFSAIVIYSIYFVATRTQVVTQKQIKREKYRYEELTSPSTKRQLGVQAQSHFLCALVGFPSRPKYNRVHPDGFQFFLFIAKTASHMGVNNTGHIS